MRYYTEQHQFYCGIDLHARQMYLCIIDSEGKIQLHRNMPTTVKELGGALCPYSGSDLVVACECVFTRQGYAAGTGSQTSATNDTSPSSSAMLCT
jgi:hypothetical protein